jgi:hypothetical protein
MRPPARMARAMPYMQIISPNPTPEAPDETAHEVYLSEVPGVGSYLLNQTNEGFVARHLTPGHNLIEKPGEIPIIGSDTVQEFKESPESESHRAAVEFHRKQVEAIPSQAQLARRPWDYSWDRSPDVPKDVIRTLDTDMDKAIAREKSRMLYQLPERTGQFHGQPLLSAEEANARYGFEGPDGKPVKIADEPMPDDVARELGARAKEKATRQSIIARWNAVHSYESPDIGLSGSNLGFLAMDRIPSPYGFLTQLLTPDTAAMAFIPGVGEEALLARLGTGFAARTTAKAISGATTFTMASGAMMAADKLLPDWRGERADLSLREAMHELYMSAATGAIMHAAINPAIGAAWTQGKRIALQRLQDRARAQETAPASTAAPEADQPPAQPIAPGKPIGDLTEALAQFESSDGPAKRAAMDTATGQVLEGKPVEVRPHFDPDTAEEVIRDQARQDRDGYAPGFDPATLAEEIAKIYFPEEPHPERFEKQMGAPIVTEAQTWAQKAIERQKLAKDIALMEEASWRWAESGASPAFPQGPLLADSLNCLRGLDREIEELLPRGLTPKERRLMQDEFETRQLLAAPNAGRAVSKTPTLQDILPLIPRNARGEPDIDAFRSFLAEMFGKTSWTELNGDEQRALPGLLVKEGIRPPVKTAELAPPKAAEGAEAPPSEEILKRGELPAGPVSDAIRERDRTDSGRRCRRSGRCGRHARCVARAHGKGLHGRGTRED